MFDTGNTAFMLVATSLVMLMTPGLAFFYGGLVSRKNVLTIMAQSFISMGVTSALWFIVGYSLCFSGDIGGIIGNLDMMFLKGVGINDVLSKDNNIPLLVFVAYQMMFAIITPALITGAFANRIRFKAYLIFLISWLLLVYFPICHMAWGGGLFQQWGVIDFAGGTVVHCTAGFAALAAVFFIGKRKKIDGYHSVPLVALGTALLWFGWYGFNAGSELQVDSITGLAFINTDIAASISGLTWLLMAWLRKKKPSLIGYLTGAVAGLVAITPAAGFVSIKSAFLIGIASGVVCYLAVLYKEKKGWDDALDVWGVHGIGGAVGVLMLGLLASTKVNPGGADGLFFGGGEFFVKEVLSLVIAATYAFIFTYFMLFIISKITKVKTSEAEEELGLDESIHGEEAYKDIV
ncbi:MAG: ammonium transporter [Candidatus Moranbacteria bacterium]|nr:ammonium transporter [Candidatus Moranbacteria bacterium]